MARLVVVAFVLSMLCACSSNKLPLLAIDGVKFGDEGSKVAETIKAPRDSVYPGDKRKTPDEECKNVPEGRKAKCETAVESIKITDAPWLTVGKVRFESVKFFFGYRDEENSGNLRSVWIKLGDMLQDTALFPVLRGELGKPDFEYRTLSHIQSAAIGRIAMANMIRQSVGSAQDAISRPTEGLLERHAVWRKGNITIIANHDADNMQRGEGLSYNTLNLEYDPKKVTYEQEREEYQKKKKNGWVDDL